MKEEHDNWDTDLARKALNRPSEYWKDQPLQSVLGEFTRHMAHAHSFLTFSERLGEEAKAVYNLSHIINHFALKRRNIPLDTNFDYDDEIFKQYVVELKDFLDKL